MKKLLLITFLSCLAFSAAAQKKVRLVLFKDKVGTPHSISNPSTFLSAKAIKRRENQRIAVTENDLPVSPLYVSGLAALGIKIRYTTRWFNGAIVFCEDNALPLIEALPFVKSTRNLAFNEVTAPDNRFQGGLGSSNLAAADDYFAFSSKKSYNVLQVKDIYGAGDVQNNMIGIPEMHKKGYTGKGMTVALMDGGYNNVNVSKCFDNLKVLGTWDFVNDKKEVYAENPHGAQVLSAMAAYAPNLLVSPAYEASYYLFKTEDTADEEPAEELYWTVAAERADSLGVDVINSSLGYYSFDTKSFDYAKEQMDGKTTFISRAADMAVATGMVVVVSAGNSGRGDWGIISAPADAVNVLAVGAVNRLEEYAPFSSRGPTADKRVKPDISVMGSDAAVWSHDDNVPITGNGTSFAAPILCGMVVGFWQANPSLTALQVVQAIRKSGSIYSKPNEFIGYGIPNFVRAQWAAVTGIENSPLAAEVALFPNPLDNQQLRLNLGTHAQKMAWNLDIQDVMGRILLSQTLVAGEAEQTIEATQKLPAGMYLVRLVADNQQIIKRFVKN